MGTRQICAGYLALQAVLGVAVWVAYALSATVRSWFELMPEQPEVTDAFFFADLVVVAGSALAAWAIRTDKPWAVPVVAFTAGGVVYPTVYLFAWSAFTDGGGAAALTVMIPVSTLTSWVLYQTWRTRPRVWTTGRSNAVGP